MRSVWGPLVLYQGLVPSMHIHFWDPQSIRTLNPTSGSDYERIGSMLLIASM